MCSEEAAIELEALQCTYADQLQASLPDAAGATAIAVQLVPRGTDDDSQRFVQGHLRVLVPSTYPQSLPELELADVKGLSDAQVAECLARLQGEAEALQGEMMLGHLCEEAIDFLTDANHPSGDCVFCLGPVGPAAGEAPAGHEHALSPAYNVVKLDCFHCFHMPCFAPWWQWQQRQLAQREAQLRSEYKAMAEGKLREEQIERDEEGVYTVRCPSCRAAVPPASLRHAWPALQGATADSWSQQGGKAPLGLDQDTARRLKQLQRRHEAVLSRQQAAGGIIEKGVAVSLADLQLAAERVQQQQQQRVQQQQQQKQAAVAAPATAGQTNGTLADKAAAPVEAAGRGREALRGGGGRRRGKSSERRHDQHAPRTQHAPQAQQQQQQQQRPSEGGQQPPRHGPQQQWSAQDGSMQALGAQPLQSHPRRQQQAAGSRGSHRPRGAQGDPPEAGCTAAPPGLANGAQGQPRQQQQQQQQNQQQNQPAAGRPRSGGGGRGSGGPRRQPSLGQQDKSGTREQGHQGRGEQRRPLQQPRG